MGVNVIREIGRDEQVTPIRLTQLNRHAKLAQLAITDSECRKPYPLEERWRRALKLQQLVAAFLDQQPLGLRSLRR